MPYALARPALRGVLAESKPSSDEQKLIEDVTRRVRIWKEVGPYYRDQYYGNGSSASKQEESRGTEAVLNALILANRDAELGYVSAETRAAFENMWALQRRSGEDKGAWRWLQFDEEPWESKNSVYYGATLAALATGLAPADYASSLGIQNDLTLLREYLHREMPYQTTLNRVFLLWASTKLPGLLTSEQQNAIIKEVLRRQQPDGGWRLASITWNWRRWNAVSLIQMWLREDGTPMTGKSDGVATGLITLVLQKAGMREDNAQLQHGLSWLMAHQNAEGFWPASSLNKKRNPSSGTGRFMNDAATAFSVMSLTQAQQAEQVSSSSAKH